MDNRNWNILCWNVRGINASDKWDAVRNKIDESSCSIVCLQETKKENFDMAFIKHFAPRRLDYYDYIPQLGLQVACWSFGIARFLREVC